MESCLRACRMQSTTSAARQSDGIWAKPIVDILIELPDDAAIESAKVRLAAHGYLAMADRDLNKGYTPEGFAERVFHVHLAHCRRQ